MMTVALAIGLIAGSAPGQVVECPAEHEGARLIGAAMYHRDEKAELVGGPQKVPGGFDVDYGFNRGDVKWVACWYKPKTPVWYRVSPAATRCHLTERTVSRGLVTAVVRCK